MEKQEEIHWPEPLPQDHLTHLSDPLLPAGLCSHRKMTFPLAMHLDTTLLFSVDEPLKAKQNQEEQASDPCVLSTPQESLRRWRGTPQAHPPPVSRLTGCAGALGTTVQLS